MKESEIQSDILNYLNLEPDIFAWRNQTTGIYDAKAGVFRKTGGFSIRGASDILGLIKPSGRLIAIEVKSAKGKLSDDQVAFLSKVNRQGGAAVCVRSLDEAVFFIKQLKTGEFKCIG